MANTPILDIPQVSPNQNQKESTINTGVAILEQAANAELKLTLTGARTVTKAEFTRHYHFRFSGHSAAAVITLPSTPRGLIVSNEGSAALTLRTAGTGATAQVEPGARRLVISNGVDVFVLSA